MKATLSNYHQSPRKVRLVAKSLQGKKVSQAEMELGFMVKRAALPLEKLLASAVANAVNQSGLNKEDLVIKAIAVDKGLVAKRYMPRAFGRASRINKRSSHITIVLGEKDAASVKSKAKATPKAAPVKKVTQKKAPVKKVAPKKEA